jgi:hypothetical protein
MAPVARRKGEYDYGCESDISALNFLRSIPDTALHFLTHLVVVVPAPRRVCEEPTSFIWISWLQAIQLLSAHNRLDSLTLEVHITNDTRLRYWEECWSPRLVAETRKDYFRVVAPLASLRGRLGKLFVYAVLETYCSEFRRDNPEVAAALERFEKERGKLEVDLARAVMGYDYDPVAEGKAPRSFFFTERDRNGYITGPSPVFYH